MAERRMMAKSVIDTDAFLDMPASTQSLYFHMLLRADDDGFIASPKGILRIIGASDDDLKLLLAKQYLFRFESGVVVIKDWKIHNYIKSDRYKPSMHPERELLTITANKEYTLINSDAEEVEPKCIQSGTKMEPECIQNGTIGKVRLGKVRLGKNNILSSKHDFADEIIQYLNMRTGAKYKSTTSKTKQLINARVNEGFTLDDFKTVIDKKCVEWCGTEFEKFLRPNTLFGTKFESYLNQHVVKPKTKKSDAIDAVKDLYMKYGGDNYEQETTDSESTINITASVQY